jgi:hypothetical protein
MGIIASHGHDNLRSRAGNKVAMWRTADPPTRVQIPPRP